MPRGARNSPLASGGSLSGESEMDQMKEMNDL